MADDLFSPDPPARAGRAADRRRGRGCDVRAGCLLSDGRAEDCAVEALSLEGASVRCERPPAAGTMVTLRLTPKPVVAGLVDLSAEVIRAGAGVVVLAFLDAPESVAVALAGLREAR